MKLFFLASNLLIFVFSHDFAARNYAIGLSFVSMHDCSV